MPRLIGNEAFEVTFEGLEQFTYRGRIQLGAVGHGNQRQRMDLHLLSQDFYGADTGNLVTLLDAADVAAAGGQQHVFLHQAACRAQLAQRSTEVGLGWNTLSGRHLPISAQRDQKDHDQLVSLTFNPQQKFSGC